MIRVVLMKAQGVKEDSQGGRGKINDRAERLFSIKETADECFRLRLLTDSCKDEQRCPAS